MSSVMFGTLKAIALSAALSFAMLLPATAVGVQTILAENGTARMPVVVAPGCSEPVRKSAEQLAAMLQRMSGALFDMVEGGGGEGIAVGTYRDFPDLELDIEFASDDPFRREEYLLRTVDGGAYLIGATDLAVQHAVWDFLYRLGYRQYFPGAVWEVVPAIETVRIELDTLEAPDYLARRIWYNWGMRWGYNVKPYNEWQARNRMARGFELRSGHAYGNIHQANKRVFDDNPQFYALVNGERKYRGGDTKFCIGNPELRKLVVDHAVKRVRDNPDMDSISMDPSDGGGWCDADCDLCAALGSGSISDRALTLANDVAAAISELGLGDKYVGMYAYNQHGPPPTIDVHDKVIMSVATGFLRGGYSLAEIIEGWRERGARLGIYDYFSVVAWDWNLPRRARGGRVDEVADRIREFHNDGARFFDAESGDAWGPYGLGYYVAGRVMWDVDEAGSVGLIIDEFIEKSFGPAREPMAKFYHLIAVDKERRSAGDLLGRMYRHLDQAQRLADEHSGVLERIEHLILYTRYAELYQQYADATGGAKEKARETLLAHVYRMRETMMVHSYGIWARLIGQGAAHTDDHELKDDRPFSNDDIAVFLDQGIKNNVPVDLDFTAIEYSEDLVPAAERLALDEVDTVGNHPPVPQDRHNYLIWVEAAPAEIPLDVTVRKVWDLRPHAIKLFSPKEVYIEAVDTSDIVRPDGETYKVILKTPYSGLHRIEVVDGGDYTRIAWPDGMPVTLPSREDTPGVGNHFRGEWSLYFYVPKGTETVGGWAARIASWAPRLSGLVRDGDGNKVHDFSAAEDGFFNIKVPTGQDGRLWKFEKSQGVRLMMTVPPYLARSGKELLLPREVVEADEAQ